MIARSILRLLSQTLIWAIALSLFKDVTASQEVPPNVDIQTSKADRTRTSSVTSANSRLRFARSSRTSSQAVHLATRFPFSAGRDDWCGELAEGPATDFSASAPQAADCQALIGSLGSEDGFWALQPGDFSASDGWARVVSSGTCSFAARYADADSAAASPVRIGTNDVRFYTTTYSGLAQDGKLGLQGTVQCNNDESTVFVTWGLIHS